MFIAYISMASSLILFFTHDHVSMAPASQHTEGGHHLCVFLCENQIRALWSQSYTLRETDVTQPSVSVVCLRGCCVLVMACKLNHMHTEVSGALHAPHLLLRAISCCGV